MIAYASRSAKRAKDDVWDVVVIGAGPAGGLAARQLAMAGARTLLVDRCAFPRPKVCGACINQHALALLRSVGLGRFVRRLGGVPLECWQLRCGGRGVCVPLPGGMAVSRSRFDAALVEAACAAGAIFLPEVMADAMPAESGQLPGSRCVRLIRSGRPARYVQGRVVLAADGLGHPSLRNSGEFRSRVAVRSRIGLGATIDEFPSGWERRSIYMAVGEGGYVGLVRVEDGGLNVAAAVDPCFVQQNGGPTAAVTTILHAAGFPPIQALSKATWRGTLPLTRETSPPAGTRIFLLGDAAGYVEPFTGEGIAWALTSAVAVVPLVLEAVGGWSPRLARKWSRVHRGRIGRWHSICRLVTAGVRRPTIVRSMIRMFSVSPPLGRIVAEQISGSRACQGLCSS